MENIHYDAIMQMIPELTRTVNISSNEILDEDMLFSGTFQNLFALALRIMKEKDGVYQRALEEIDILVELIEEETK